MKEEMKQKITPPAWMPYPPAWMPYGQEAGLEAKQTKETFLNRS
jgi:hypothetical protein